MAVCTDNRLMKRERKQIGSTVHVVKVTYYIETDEIPGFLQ